MNYFLHLYSVGPEEGFHGHHHPDVVIPIRSNTTIAEIKELLKEKILKHWDVYVHPEAMLEAAKNLVTQHSDDYAYFQDFEVPEGSLAVFLGLPI